MTVRDEFGFVPEVNGCTFAQALQQAIEGAQPLAAFLAKKRRYVTSEEWRQLAAWLGTLQRRRGHPPGHFRREEQEAERYAVRCFRRLRNEEFPGRKRLPKDGTQDALIKRAVKLAKGEHPTVARYLDLHGEERVRILLKARSRLSLKRYRITRI
jgi:hypothetical protein